MSNQPTHYISVVSGDGEKARFTRVGALWPTKSGGLSGEIRAGIAVSGRIVISERKADEDAEAEESRRPTDDFNRAAERQS